MKSWKLEIIGEDKKEGRNRIEQKKQHLKYLKFTTKQQNTFLLLFICNSLFP